MSSSFVGYKGKGFWSHDPYLVEALSLCVRVLGTRPAEPWLADLRTHWQAQASGAFAGWVHPDLDDFLTDHRRTWLVLDAVLESQVQPTGSPEARATLELLAQLLRGECTTDESSPLQYMIGGGHPG